MLFINEAINGRNREPNSVVPISRISKVPVVRESL